MYICWYVFTKIVSPFNFAFHIFHIASYLYIFVEMIIKLLVQKEQVIGFSREAYIK